MVGWLRPSDGNCTSYPETVFGYWGGNAGACLDSNGQTADCDSPPGWVIGPYAGGITGECTDNNCMLDSVGISGGVPGEVWIKAAEISGTP